jgi:hypothetical protein
MLRRPMFAIMRWFRTRHKMQKRKNMVDRWKLSTVSVDAGPTWFSSNVTTSRGTWPSPQTEAGKGAASATPDPSRIDQTSRIPMEFCSGHLFWV